MPAYRIEFVPAAFRQFKAFPDKAQKRLALKIDGLSSDPRPAGCAKLKGSRNIYRVRLGVYRILYQIRGEDLLILVVGIAHRSKAYRRTGGLK